VSKRVCQEYGNVHKCPVKKAVENGGRKGTRAVNVRHRRVWERFVLYFGDLFGRTRHGTGWTVSTVSSVGRGMGDAGEVGESGPKEGIAGWPEKARKREWTHSSIANPTTVNGVRNGCRFPSPTTSGLLPTSHPFSLSPFLFLLPSVLPHALVSSSRIREKKRPRKASKRLDHLQEDNAPHSTPGSAGPVA
jgi:hypothetical protein